MKREKEVMKLCFVFVLACLLVAPFTQAILTEIKIKTMPWHDVQITAFEPGKTDFVVINRSVGRADAYGDFVTSMDIKKDKFNLIVYIKKNDEKVMPGTNFPEDYLEGGSYAAGDSISLEVAPSGFEFVQSPGVENQTEVVENETEEVLIEEVAETSKEVLISENEVEVSSTGFSIFGDNGIFSKKIIYFVVGFLFLLVIAGFTVGVIRKKKRLFLKDKTINIRKLSDLKKEKEEDLKERKEDVSEYQKVIEEAEKKIEEAQRDIKKLKNEEKIKEIKKKIEEDEKELIKLREGKD